MNRPVTVSKRPMVTFALIVLIFLIPMILAWVLYRTHDTLGSGTVNRGTFITPPRNMSKLVLTQLDGSAFDQKTLRGYWLMLYVTPGRCDENCQKALYNMRQIRVATGKEMERVKRVLLQLSAQPKPANLPQNLQNEYAGTFFVNAPEVQFQQLMGNLPSTKLALTQGYLYLVDPLGNIMLGYAGDANTSGIFKDLQRLLKVSQIG